MYILMTNTGAKLVGADSIATSIVYDALSYDDDTPRRKAGFGAGSLNSKKSFLMLPGLIFQAGFVPLVRQVLSENGYPTTVDDQRNALNALGPAIDLANPTRIDDDGYPLYAGYLNGPDMPDGVFEMYDFQANTVEEAVRVARGIVQIATGGGKTEVACALTKRVGRKTLFLTHKLDLVDQTRARYKKRLGVVPGKISEGEWMPSEITVATVQTIMAHMRVLWQIEGLNKKGRPDSGTYAGDTEETARTAAKADFSRIDRVVLKKDDRSKVMAFLQSVECLIVDEAHRASGNGFFVVTSNCINAYFRFYLTATPLMKGKREDDLRMIATSGSIICRITNAELIARGILARPSFIFSEVPAFGFNDRIVRRELAKKYEDKGRKMPMGVVYRAAYERGIIDNLVRNQMVVSDTRELVAKGRKTVVLFKEIRHGKILYDMIRAAGMTAALVFGEDDIAVREDAKRRLREGEVQVLIASTILDEGIDEPSISGVVLAGGGKSKISLFQRVGRAARKKRGDELELLGNTCEIRDYVDTGQKDLMKHSALRFHAVKTEEGWVIEKIRPFPKSAA